MAIRDVEMRDDAVPERPKSMGCQDEGEEEQVIVAHICCLLLLLSIVVVFVVSIVVVVVHVSTINSDMAAMCTSGPASAVCTSYHAVEGRSDDDPP